MTTENLWLVKLAARLHDPAEKALVLLRDPEGHERGTSLVLKRLLGLEREAETGPVPVEPDSAAARVFPQGLPHRTYQLIRRADWWAAGADRPNFPIEKRNGGSAAGPRGPDWTQVRWSRDPILIHPLSGQQIDLRTVGGLSEIAVEDIKNRSGKHFSALADLTGYFDETRRDPRRTYLAFWRFGPFLDVTGSDEGEAGRLGALWQLLPADTRIPDHSIWDHLDLTSAFAGAFAADPEGDAALLAFAIGPVQPFISAARSTSDLWAGSHLLSRLAWEAMRPICEELGPDAVIFPSLRTVPQVDLWLRDRMELPGELFHGLEWTVAASDANPLFSASLPNRFVAVVPSSRLEELARMCSDAVRTWMQDLGRKVVTLLLEAADLQPQGYPFPYEQMQRQLQDFPEVYWAGVPFSLIRPRNERDQTDLDVSELLHAMAPFHGVDPGTVSGFLATPAWRVLQKDIALEDGTRFYQPKPGVLYPAVYELVERLLAGAKSARPFRQRTDEGWRCSLTGESECLSLEPQHLHLPPGKRRAKSDQEFREGEHVETLWARITHRKPAWSRRGEHLGGLAAVKRLWPTVFAEEVAKALPETSSAGAVPRFVVSTHTMALAHQLEKWLDSGTTVDPELETLLKDQEPVALPRRLHLKHRKNGRLKIAMRIPSLLESEEGGDKETPSEAENKVRSILAQAKGARADQVEKYYALLLMDGDRMGAILSGEEAFHTSYLESFHPQVQMQLRRLAERHPLLNEYAHQCRAPSPGRHSAISSALRDFSQSVVRFLVEEAHPGRLIYAGGDDLLAMLPVADLLTCMGRLRAAYSGDPPPGTQGSEGIEALGRTLSPAKGFAVLRRGSLGQASLKIMRTMGSKATASAGAVVAHYQAPLTAVMRELRAAEQRAKSEGGRDAFSISVVKRSGSGLRLTARWGEPLALLSDLHRFLATPGVSRRAVYNTLAWLTDLPHPSEVPEMLSTLLAYQLERQSSQASVGNQPRELADRLTALAKKQGEGWLPWLRSFLGVAEFFAREVRAQDDLSEGR